MMSSRIKLCFTQINLFCMLLFQTIVSCEGSSAHISLKVLGTGFHRLDATRNLIYRIHFDNFVEGCYAAIYLQLPSALYVNVNELNNLRRLEISTACSSGETDVELFTEKAQAQNVTICSPLLHTNCTLKFPLHQRYQYANEYGKYVNVTLPKPKLLFGCKERIKEHRISKLDLCSPCVELVAKWREVPYIMDMEDIWRSPVGDITMLPVVTYATLFITVLCTVFLTRTIICKSMTTQHPKRE